MTENLARRYEALMRVYPEAYRRERGDEILATLLERAGHRRWPPVGEVLGILAGAVQAHLSPGGAVRRAWAGGLRAAVLVLLAVELGMTVLRLLDDTDPQGRIGVAIVVVGAVALHAVLRDRRTEALATVLIWQVACVWAGAVSFVLATATLFLAAWLVTGWRAPRAPGNLGWWVAVPVAGLALGLPQLLSAEPVYDFVYQQTVVITAIVLFAVAAALDARAAVVAAALLTWQAVRETVHVTWVGDNPTNAVLTHLTGTWWGGITAVAAVALLAGGHLLARHRAGLV